jgi:hypothetical protein
MSYVLLLINSKVNSGTGACPKGTGKNTVDGKGNKSNQLKIRHKQ